MAEENKNKEQKSPEMPGNMKQDKPKNMSAAAKKMFALLWEHKISFIVVVFFTIICTILSNLGPRYLGDVIDEIQVIVNVKIQDVNASLDFNAIKKILFTILGIYTASSFMTFIQHFIMAGVNRNLIFSLREKLNKKLSVLPLKYFDSQSKGDILSRVTNDIDNIQNTFQNNFIQVISSVVSVIGVFVIMLIIDWKMTIVTVVSMPAGLIGASFILKASRKYFRLNWSTMGRLNGHIEEMYTGHKIVKVFGHTKQAIDEFNKVNDELCEIDRKAQFLSGTLNPLITFVSNIGYVLIVIFGGIFVVQGKLSIGAMTTFFVYSKLFMQPIVDLSNITNTLQSSLASGERVFEVLEQESETPDNDGILNSDTASTVTFEHVDFAYSEDKPLITDLNLTVNPGQLVALVGPTGAGKTTIINLLMRFYDVNSGAIKIDGTDIRDIPRSDLRNRFGMVLQDTWLFEGTIKENIAYGRQTATDDEIIAAAAAARADAFIRALPDGYDTFLEEGGGNLSQGQRQLLTIARAILSDPEIIILDEATSSVDTRTEVQIQTGMKELMKGKTNFVIAHRLSTIREADVILVLNDGVIIESGTHDSLMADGGFYKELYEAQFSGSDT